MRYLLLLSTVAACHGVATIDLPTGDTDAVVDPGVAIDTDADGVPAPADCDDADPSVRPGVLESCNGRDDDCDGLIDQGIAPFPGSLGPWYADADGDGVGAGWQGLHACVQPPRTSAQGGDCDDLRADVRPGALELCDGRDNDCNGLADDDDPNVQVPLSPNPLLLHADADGDGAGAAQGTWFCEAPEVGFLLDARDCDDTDASRGPEAPERCNGRDDDCDGLVDAEDPDVDRSQTVLAWRDADDDGFGTMSGSPDDERRVCGEHPPSGWVLDHTDCDDTRAGRAPDRPEVCDGLDNDCDALVDADDPSLLEEERLLLWRDADLDGFGDPSRGIVRCEGLAGWVADDTDCDDVRADVNPAATEVCNGRDDDCDRLQDDADDDAVVPTWYPDRDGDHFAGREDGVRQCASPDPGFRADSAPADCDDADPLVHPGRLDVPLDGIDQDCRDGDALCYPGEEGCPVEDCGTIAETVPHAVTGPAWLEGGTEDAPDEPVLGWCEQGLLEGGWTLAMVMAPGDGHDTWTWDGRELFSGVRTAVGDVDHLTSDYRSPLLHRLVVTELLFVHRPSGVHAAYRAPDGGRPLGQWMEERLWQARCYGIDPGVTMFAGTLRVKEDLCSTSLFLNPRDQGGTAGCGGVGSDDAWGFAWSVDDGAGCPLDRPGASGSLGPSSADRLVEADAVGFGAAARLHETADARMEVYVR
ncbi:MAG: putative metal-binding motif-containing protein [Alphaproteobacteria bacterium]|nr:putative metal-binding motif-containing protein [Alphaproteobacteria bacterium]